MPNHLLKYYTFHDEFPEQKISKEFCNITVQDIIKTYTKESIFRTMSSLAQAIGLSNDFNELTAFLEKEFGIPKTLKAVIIHRQAICVIYQFLFSLNKDGFGNESQIPKNDVFLLFILANQLTEFVEYERMKITASIPKKIFFANIKEIHFTNNRVDLQAGFYLFKKYYSLIIQLNKEEYNNVITKMFGFEIEEYIKILELIEERNYTEIFSLFDKYAVLDFNDSNQLWNERKLKLPIPNEMPFIQKYPMIKIEKDYLIVDLHSLFSSLFKNLYRTLIEYDNISFKGEFGKKIVEPTIIDLITETFVDSHVKTLKVGSRKFEYGDFGLLHNDCIFLFEIKSSLLNDASIYTNRYDIFMKIFNDKFVKKEGIKQQVTKIQLIENNFEHFCSLSKIPPKRYTIYPILLSFDESLMSFACNWYLSMRFEVFKRICKLKISKFDIACSHSTLTFNEIFRMRYVDKTPSERLQLLKQYSDDQNKNPIPFSFYLQELNEFTIAK